MQLPIAIHYKDEVYTECEFEKPKSGVLANTLDIFENQGDFQAILEFISSSITCFINDNGKIEQDKKRIRAICRKMSYISAEVIAIYVMLLINKDDWIEGVYRCPRCGKEIITGSEEGNADKIEDLKITNEKDNNNILFFELVKPIQIKHAVNGNVIEEINSIHMTYPNIDNCIKGSVKYPTKEIKRQFAIYTEAIEKINGEEIDVKWRKTWGDILFQEMDSDDTAQISEKMQEFGIEKELEKTCPKCGRIWKAPVNTSNFFALGLQSV